MSDQSHASMQSLSVLLEELAAQPDVSHTLESIVDLAVATIPACDFAGVTVRRGKKLMTPASTGVVVDEVDQLQYDLWQGPCVDTVWIDDTYLVPDMATENRWPDWAPAAHRLGIGSSLSVRLSTADDTIGGLNLYSRTAGAFSDDDVQIAHEYARHAAAALALAHEFTTLQTALQTRHVIGVAQGILRHRHGLTLDQSFSVMVRISRHHNVKLRDLAQIVVDSNGLPARFVGDPDS